MRDGSLQLPASLPDSRQNKLFIVHRAGSLCSLLQQRFQQNFPFLAPRLHLSKPRLLSMAFQREPSVGSRTHLVPGSASLGSGQATVPGGYSESSPSGFAILSGQQQPRVLHVNRELFVTGRLSITTGQISRLCCLH